MLTIYYCWDGYINNNNWRIGDWLINYKGGFIRRGFFGEIVFQLFLHTNIAPNLYVFLFQVLFYLCYFIFSFLLLKQQKYIIPYVLLIFSPFIFTFQLHDVQGGYRKEIVYFAILAFMVWFARNNNVNTFGKVFIIMLLMYPLVILSHEMSAVYLPYVLIVYVVKVRLNINLKSLIVIVLLLGLSLICFVMSIISQGTEDQVIAIYSSLGGYAPADGGAISWLSKNPTSLVNLVVSNIYERRFLNTYFIVLMLSFLAFIPILSKYKIIFRNRINLLLFFVSIFGTVPLFMFAVDWGRFIYIHLVSLFIISLLPNKDISICKNGIGIFLFCNKNTYITNKVKICFNVILVVFVIAYSLFWRLPYCGGRPFFSSNMYSIFWKLYYYF
jgi:hypothetical protein